MARGSRYGQLLVKIRQNSATLTVSNMSMSCPGVLQPWWLKGIESCLFQLSTLRVCLSTAIAAMDPVLRWRALKSNCELQAGWSWGIKYSVLQRSPGSWPFTKLDTVSDKHRTWTQFSTGRSSAMISNNNSSCKKTVPEKFRSSYKIANTQCGRWAPVSLH
jgi:hypothetical protein